MAQLCLWLVFGKGNLKFLLTNYANENAGKFWPKIANWKTTEKF